MKMLSSDCELACLSTHKVSNYPMEAVVFLLQKFAVKIFNKNISFLQYKRDNIGGLMRK